MPWCPLHDIWPRFWVDVIPFAVKIDLKNIILCIFIQHIFDLVIQRFNMIVIRDEIECSFIQDVHTPSSVVLLHYQVANSLVLAKQQLCISYRAIELSYPVWYRCSSFSVYVSSIRYVFCFAYSFNLPPIVLGFREYCQ